MYFYDNFKSVLFSVFIFNLIKPDEVGKSIANETSLTFRNYEEFSSFYFTIIDRKPSSFITIKDIWVMQKRIIVTSSRIC